MLVFAYTAIPTTTMRVQLMTTPQAMHELIRSSCELDDDQSEASTEEQLRYHHSLLMNPRMLAAAYEYLHGLRDRMPKVVGTHCVRFR